MDLLRREGRHRSAAGPSLDDEELNWDVPDAAPSPQEEAERRELRAQIEANLQVLALVLGLDDKTEENQKAVDLGSPWHAAL